MLPRTNQSPQLGSSGYIHGSRFDVKQESAIEILIGWPEPLLRFQIFSGRRKKTNVGYVAGERDTYHDNHHTLPILISVIPVLEAKSTAHGIFAPRTSGIKQRTFRLPTSKGGFV